VTCADANPVVCEDSCPEGFDGDGDGHPRCGEDCDDDNGAVFPGALEDCFDGVDQDCNGQVDDTGCLTCATVEGPKGMYLLCPYGAGLEKALAYCSDWGGHLLVIDDADEADWVKSTMVQRGLDRLWLGLTDAADEGQWTDYSGLPLGFSGWGSGEPNNWGGNEDCAQVYASGVWNDMGCDGSHPLLCEK
jgi:hypothetical protein